MNLQRAQKKAIELQDKSARLSAVAKNFKSHQLKERMKRVIENWSLYMPYQSEVIQGFLDTLEKSANIEDYVMRG